MGLMKALFGDSKKKQTKRKTTTATKKASSTRSANTTSIAQLKRQMAEDDRKMDRLFEASAAVDESDDFYKAMAEYKKAIDALSDHNIDNYRMGYASDLIKHGDLDEAWAYLNGLIVSNQNLTPGIRKEQVRILKKEAKWSEALRFLLFHYVERCAFGVPGFNRNAFMRDLKPIANKLHLTEEEREYFADLLERQIARKNYKVQTIDKAFKKFTSDKGWN